MDAKRLTVSVVCLAVLVLSAIVGAEPVGTAFLYQGQLAESGVPVSGSADFVFALFDSPSGGSQVGETVQAPEVAVSHGLFTVDLDFGDAIPLDRPVWLIVAVRSPAGSGDYTPLSPRQPIRPTPLASALPYLRPQAHNTSPNLLGGHSANAITPAVHGAVIGGGGRQNFPNTITDDYGVVAGGYDNHAGDGLGDTDDADFATVGGGVSNHATGSWSTIGGGQINTASGARSTVGGGASNEAGGGYSTASGGWGNDAGGFTAVVGGGQDNTASAVASAIGGGIGNTATAQNATVPGGYYNTADGRSSFAAGTAAHALHDGTFVWADEHYAAFDSTGDHQFLIRAAGGVGIGTNEPDAPLTVVNETEEDAAIVASGPATRGEVGHVSGGARGTYLASGNRGRLGAALGGVVGEAGSGSAASGVLGTSAMGHGVSAASVDVAAVYGLSANAEGVRGVSPTVGVAGEATQSTGQSVGVKGTSISDEGRGVYGEGTYAGVLGRGMGETAPTYGVRGETNLADGTGVYGLTSAGSGVSGRALTDGDGVFGLSATGNGVSGQSQSRGVSGTATDTSGSTQGVYGQTFSEEGSGVYGLSVGGGYGVLGAAPTGAGGIGVYGWSLRHVGVYGSTQDSDVPGVYGTGVNRGVVGEIDAINALPSSLFMGVSGRVDGGYSENRGVNGRATGSEWYNIGVYGSADNSGNVNIGVYGTADDGWPSPVAGYFDGDVLVTGNIAKGGGSFKIDHPLDPANKYLYHAFVESPDMMNVYNGNVMTDGEGLAVVELPEWFDALNRDFRYQLTVIGQFAQAILAEEIKGNQFTIKTDKPHVKVSWLVTGIRKDPYADAHRIPVEQEKPAHERGRYLHPEARGLAKELRVNYELSVPAAARGSQDSSQ